MRWLGCSWMRYFWRSMIDYVSSVNSCENIVNFKMFGANRNLLCVMITWTLDCILKVSTSLRVKNTLEHNCNKHNINNTLPISTSINIWLWIIFPFSTFTFYLFIFASLKWAVFIKLKKSKKLKYKPNQCRSVWMLNMKRMITRSHNFLVEYEVLFHKAFQDFWFKFKKKISFHTKR